MRKILLILLAFCCLLQAQTKELVGAGATFPYPLYAKMFDVYKNQYQIRVNYQSIGSGGGIQQLINKTVDFGATDAFLNEEELKKAGAHVVHMPVCLGSVVVVYNLPGVTALQLSQKVLAEIYLGKIKKWDDPSIASVNIGVKLPNLPIVVVRRSDGSGTSYIFTEFLSKVYPEWKEKIGFGKSVQWPTGLGAKGNEGVSGMIKQMPGSIGYTELVYAMNNKIQMAAIQNKKGKYIKASMESVSKSASAEIAADTRVSLTDTDAENGYPLSSFTWIIIYKEQKYGNNTFEKVKSLVDLLWWMTHDGQRFAEPLNYAPLPKSVVDITEKNLKSVTFDGKSILQ